MDGQHDLFNNKMLFTNFYVFSKSVVNVLASFIVFSTIRAKASGWLEKHQGVQVNLAGHWQSNRFSNLTNFPNFVKLN